MLKNVELVLNIRLRTKAYTNCQFSNGVNDDLCKIKTLAKPGNIVKFKATYY